MNWLVLGGGGRCFGGGGGETGTTWTHYAIQCGLALVEIFQFALCYRTWDNLRCILETCIAMSTLWTACQQSTTITALVPYSTAIDQSQNAYIYMLIRRYNEETKFPVTPSFVKFWREFCLFVISYSKLYTLKVYWALFNGIGHFITHICLYMICCSSILPLG